MQIHRTTVSQLTAILSLGIFLAVSDGTIGRSVATPGPVSRGPAFQVKPIDSDATERTLRSLARLTDSVESKKVWVYFTDKEIFDSEHCGERLAAVRAGLDPHAAARRAKSMNEETGFVDFLDIPVSKRYTAALEQEGAEVIRASRWLNAVSVRASLGDLHAIARLPFVQKLEPVLWFHPSKVRIEERRSKSAGPIIGQAGDLFDYGASRWQLEEINVLAAHDAGYSGAGVIVAMLDTGFDYTHETFQEIVASGRLLAQYDFVYDDGDVRNEEEDDSNQHNHGTYTWSTLGGFTDGTLVGPAYGASFLLAKTEDLINEEPIEEDNWVAGAEWADANGADVLSSSLGYKDWYTYEDMDGNTAVTTIAADIAVSRGIVVCTSAGNEGGADWFYMIAPADGDSVIAVGAVDSLNQVAGFSSRGPTLDGRTKPDVVARGAGTYCASPFDPEFPYRWISGTSLSCPLVGGAAALVIEARPTWTPMMVRDALRNTADSAANPDNERGWGRIDVMAAIDAQSGVPDGGPAPVGPVLVAAPNPFAGEIRFEFALPSRMPGTARLEIFDVGGRRVFERRLESGSERNAGSVRWNGRDETGRSIAPGVYLARLSAGDWRVTAKVVSRD